MTSDTVFFAVTIPTIFIVSLIGGFLPLKFSGNPEILSIINSLGGGIFLSSSFVHLLPEAVSQLAETTEDLNDFPLAYFLCAVGFLGVFLIEEVSQGILKSYTLNQLENEDGKSGRDGTDKLEMEELEEPRTPDTAHSSHMCGSGGASESDPSVYSTISYKECCDHNDAPVKIKEEKGLQSAQHLVLNAGHGDEDGDDHPRLTAVQYPQSEHHHHHHHHHHHADLLLTRSPPKGAVLTFLVALSAHALLAGIVLGAQGSEGWGVFVAIIAHKGLETFALGTSFVRAEWARKIYILFMVSFAFVTPLGALIGIITSSDEEGPAAGVINSLAAGTFLFIATIEVIAVEFADPHVVERKRSVRRWKIVALLVGFLVMSSILIYGISPSHDHDHEHDESETEEITGASGSGSDHAEHGDEHEDHDSHDR